MATTTTTTTTTKITTTTGRGLAPEEGLRAQREGGEEAAADLQIIRAQRDLRVTLRARPLSILARFFTSLLLGRLCPPLDPAAPRVSPRYRETRRGTERESALKDRRRE